MDLDLAESQTLKLTFLAFFILFFFFPANLGIKIFLFSFLVYLIVFFILCVGWASETNKDKKFIIGLLVTLFHGFIFILGSSLGIFLAFLVSKFFSFEILKNFLKGLI